MAKPRLRSAAAFVNYPSMLHRWSLWVAMNLASASDSGYSCPMIVLSVRIGLPRSLPRRSGEVITAGVKAEVSCAKLGFAGFEGDGVSNHSFHGGPDRTACVYPAAHYRWWKSERGYDLPWGSFFENLTVEGLAEEDVCIGDRIRVGTALAQISLPRDPCGTIDRILEIPSLHTMAQKEGRCGFHMRTLEEGLVRPGDSFEVVERGAGAVSVAAALDLYHGRSSDRDLLELLLGLPDFADEGKRELNKRHH